MTGAEPETPAGLIGRDAAFERLVGLVRSPGSGGVVLVKGPAGIGKSTLVRALTGWAEGAGLRVGWGVAGEFEGAPALWPWFEAMSGVDPQQSAVAEGTAPSPSATDKAALFRAVAQWMAEVQTSGPVLLVLEDLHDADHTALELLSYLTRRPLPAAATIVATARPGHELLESLRCPHVTMRGLTPEQILELARADGHPLDPAQAQDLARRTDGNPLFVQRLLEHVGQYDDVGRSLPADIVGLLRAQMDSAPEATRGVLDALSVLGTSDVGLLARVADAPDGEASVARIPGNLVEIDDDQASFRHGLLRELLYEDLPTARRFALHARAADALRSVGAGPIAIAYHLARAASTHRTLEAATAAVEAARIELSTGALFEAAEHFNLGCSILRDLDEPVRLASTMIEEATVLGHLGRVVDAEALLDAVAELEAHLPPVLRRRVIREYGRLRWREEPNPSALSARNLENMARALLLPANAPEDQVVLATALVSAAEIRGIQPSDLESADRAVEVAGQTDDPVLVGEAYLAQRRALMVHPERLADRAVAAETALQAASEAGDTELIGRARRHARCDALATGDRGRAVALIAEGEALSAGAREHEALSRAGLAGLEGRWDDAELILDEATKELSYLGVDAPALDFVRLAFDWDRGTLGDALRTIEPLLPAIADPGLRAAVALAKAMDGEVQVASTLVSEAVAGLSTGTPSVLWSMSCAIVAETAAAIDHPDVPQIYDMLGPYADQCAVPAAAGVPWVGSIQRPLGLLCLRMDRNEEALAHLERSLAVHDRMCAEPWSARSHAALAVATGRLGLDERRIDHARTADELVSRLGMGDGVALVGDFDATPAQPAPPPDRMAGPGRQGRFLREGDSWRVGLDGATALVRAASGFEYLSRLIEQPEVDWHVLDLYATVSGAPVVVEGHGGFVLDDEARSSYQRRHRELSADLDGATADADAGAIQAINDEIEMLEHEVLGAFGLGGRARTMDDPVEKARINVRRSISRAFDRIEEYSPDLAGHLRRAVQTGRFCRYSPDPSATVLWNTEPGT